MKVSAFWQFVIVWILIFITRNHWYVYGTSILSVLSSIMVTMGFACLVNVVIQHIKISKNKKEVIRNIAVVEVYIVSVVVNVYLFGCVRILS